MNELLEEGYKTKIEKELMDISNLEEYTIDSTIGCDLTDLYKRIIEAALCEKVHVSGDEISDGKYKIMFLMPDGKEYTTISKTWDTKEEVLDNIMNVITKYKMS